MALIRTFPYFFGTQSCRLATFFYISGFRISQSSWVMRVPTKPRNIPTRTALSLVISLFCFDAQSVHCQASGVIYFFHIKADHNRTYSPLGPNQSAPKFVHRHGVQYLCVFAMTSSTKRAHKNLRITRNSLCVISLAVYSKRTKNTRTHF